MASVTEQVGKFICSFGGDPLPSEVFYNSKVAVLDCVGVALAGSQEPVSNILREYVRSTTSRGESTIWGTPHKVSSTDAAMVNGAMSHALDYDDISRPCLGHPSAILVPAVFAVAESRGCSGRKLLEGYIVGLEVMAKLGRVLSSSAYERSFHPTSVLGVMGACASASYLLQLSYGQTISALGIAASEASGIKKNFGTMVKALHAGSAARKGISAALLAEKGLTANPQALDGKFGFLQMFEGETPYDVTALDSLGKPLEIISSGLVFKRYPCCGGLHCALDNIMEMRQEVTLLPEQIKDVECKVHPRRIPYLNRPVVRNGLEAKFSYQYCVATLLVDGWVGLGHFPNEIALRSEVQSLMEKVRMVPDEGFREFTSEVTIRTSDGRVFSKMMHEPKGSPDFPLTEDEIFQKFLDCASVLLKPPQAERAGKAIMSLDQEAVPDRILSLLRQEG